MQGQERDAWHRLICFLDSPPKEAGTVVAAGLVLVVQWWP